MNDAIVTTTRAWTIEDVRAAAAHSLGLVSWTETSDDENLLEYGMDSLRMMRLAGAMRAGGYDIPLRQLAKNPTINGWYRLLSEQADTKARSL
ncbi:phosphopantetheine-binding protein [Antrihabitans stalactiti]|nr:phosphopantetheine-binding protein [Antrihabitans stalactiti]